MHPVTIYLISIGTNQVITYKQILIRQRCFFILLARDETAAGKTQKPSKSRPKRNGLGLCIAG